LNLLSQVIDRIEIGFCVCLCTGGTKARYQDIPVASAGCGPNDDENVTGSSSLNVLREMDDPLSASIEQPTPDGPETGEDHGVGSQAGRDAADGALSGCQPVGMAAAAPAISLACRESA
jgi:hypothetical protein